MRISFPSDHKLQASQNKKVVIFGAGGFARVASVYFATANEHEVAAFTVHERYLREKELLGREVVPFEQLAERFPPQEYALFIAIGYERLNKARAEVYETCKDLGYQLLTYISPRAQTWEPLEIGDNCYVDDFNSIHPFVKIGNDVLIGSGGHIGHDCVIGDHAFIAGNVLIAGHAHIGQRAFIGASATIRDGITVAEDSVIGAGAIILRDTQPGEIYIAEPTRTSRIPRHLLEKLMHTASFRKPRMNE
jgi:sugar O-acyltransferase (sialic acid O-acetyltransferase NeuD family)